MDKIVSLVLASVMMLAVLVACGEKKDDGTITFGTNAEFPPFEYVTAKGVIGEFDGIDMAIAKELARTMPAKCRSKIWNLILCCWHWRTDR